jgi:drug/metabolite transporter (DMT)-like permease
MHKRVERHHGLQEGAKHAERRSVLGSGYAYRLFHGVIASAGSAVASMVTFTNPMIAAIWGILLLNEELHWYEPVGAVVIIVGAYLAQRRPATA